MERRNTLKYDRSSVSKEESKMGLLGNGRGDFGLPKSKNAPFRISTIFLIIGLILSGVVENFYLGLGLFGLYLVILSGLAQN